MLNDAMGTSYHARTIFRELSMLYEFGLVDRVGSGRRADPFCWRLNLQRSEFAQRASIQVFEETANE